jgi:hypothetical protein
MAAGVLVATWMLLVVLARRLPPGLLKDLASVLPACVTTARRLRGDVVAMSSAEAILFDAPRPPTSSPQPSAC